MSIISHDDVSQDLRRIMISGRLDTPGTNSIASQLVELAGGPKKAWSWTCPMSSFSLPLESGR